MTAGRPQLSVVIPAYRCATTIAQDVRSLQAVLDGCAPDYEILVVLDGDGDGGATQRAAEPLAGERVSVWHYERNRGKGFAVVFGMTHASGELIGFMDAGGDIDPACWRDLLAEQRAADADAVLASKRHPTSTVHYPALRRLYSVGYQLLSALLFQLPARDTQTGAKLFRGELARAVAPRILVKRFAFDVEFLAVARRYGYRTVREVPVRIEYNFDSSINVGEVFRMLWDSAAVFYRLHLLHYYDREQPVPATVHIEPAARRVQ